jgi:hypothetical protein
MDYESEKYRKYLQQMRPAFETQWLSTNPGHIHETLRLLDVVVSAVSNGSCTTRDAGLALQPLLGEEWQIDLFGGELAAIGYHAASLGDGPSLRGQAEGHSDWVEITDAVARINAAWLASGQQRG